MTRLTLSQALALKIRELLAEEGWSQREFADRLGVSQGTVSYWLGAKRRQTALDIYELLAAQFGLPLWRLFYELEGRVAAASPRPRRRGVEKGESPDASGGPVTTENYDRSLEEAMRLCSRDLVTALWREYRNRLVHGLPLPAEPPGPVDPVDAAPRHDHAPAPRGARRRSG